MHNPQCLLKSRARIGLAMSMTSARRPAKLHLPTYSVINKCTRVIDIWKTDGGDTQTKALAASGSCPSLPKTAGGNGIHHLPLNLSMIIWTAIDHNRTQLVFYTVWRPMICADTLWVFNLPMPWWYDDDREGNWTRLEKQGGTSGPALKSITAMSLFST